MIVIFVFHLCIFQFACRVVYANVFFLLLFIYTMERQIIYPIVVCLLEQIASRKRNSNQPRCLIALLYRG